MKTIIPTVSPDNVLTAYEQLPGVPEPRYRSSPSAFANITELTDHLTFAAIEPTSVVSVKIQKLANTAAGVRLSELTELSMQPRSFAVLNLFRAGNTLRSTLGAVQLTDLYWVPALRLKLKEIQQLRNDWDGEDAIPPNPEAMAISKIIVERIISRAIRESISSPAAIIPLNDGSIRFEWCIGQRELFLTATADGIETQRWDPASSVRSIHYEQVTLDEVARELEWVAA